VDKNLLILRYSKKFKDYKFIDYDFDQNSFRVRCNKCKTYFSKSKHSFYKGYGCKICLGLSRLTYLDAITKLKSKPNIYPLFSEDFWKNTYKNVNTKLPFKCLKCESIFDTTLNSLLYSNSDCPICATEYKRWRKMSYTQFLEKISKFENDKFLFDGDIWDKNYTKSKCSYFSFECVKGHIYTTTIDSYIQGTRCSVCRLSRGEEYIRKYLSDFNIQFEKEKIFKTCINPKTGGFLRFDFYLPTYNLVIEFDGIQHYNQVDFFGAESLEHIKYRDKIKTDFIKNEGKSIIRIPYWEYKNIDIILKSILFKLED